MPTTRLSAGATPSANSTHSAANSSHAASASEFNGVIDEWAAPAKVLTGAATIAAATNYAAWKLVSSRRPAAKAAGAAIFALEGAAGGVITVNNMIANAWRRR